MRTRRFLRRMVLLAGCAAALTLIAVAALETAAFKNYLARLLARQISAATQSVCTIQTVRGNLVTGATLSGITLRKQGDVVASLDRLELSYSLLPLLRGTVAIHRLTLIKPQIFLAQDNAGNWNIGPLSGGRGGAVVTGSISVHRLHIEEGTVTVSRRGTRRQAVRHISGDARLAVHSRRAQIEAQVTIKELRGLWAVPALGACAVRGTFVWDGAQVQCSAAAIETPGSLVLPEGSVTLKPSAAVQMAVQYPRLSAAELALLRGIVIAETDPCSGSISLAGPLQDMRIVQVLRSGRGSLRIAGNSNVGKPSFRGTGSFTDMNPALIAALAVPGSSLITATGTVTAELDVRGAGTSLQNFVGAVTMRVSSSAVNGVSLDYALLKAQLERGNLTISTAVVAGTAGALGLAGSGYIGGVFDRKDRVAFTGRVALDHGDPAVVAGPRFAGALSGSAEFTARKSAGARLDESEGSVSVTLRDGSCGPLTVLPSRIDAAFQEGVITITTATLRTSKFAVVAAGSVRLHRDIDVRYTAQIDDVAWIEAWYPAVSLAGAVSATGTVTGRWQEPLLALEFDATRATWNDISAERCAGVLACSAANPLRWESARLQAAGLTLGKTPVQAVSLTATSDNSKLAFAADLVMNDGYAAAVTGSVPDRITLPLTVDLAAVQMTVAHTIWASAEPAEVNIDTAAAGVSIIHLVSGDQSVRMGGRFARHGSVDLFAELRRVRLQPLPFNDNLSYSGILDARLRVAGPSADPRIDAVLAVREGSVSGIAFSSAAVTAAYAAGRAVVDGELVSEGTALFALHGTVPVSISLEEPAVRWAPDGLDLRCTARRLDIAPLAALVPGIDRAAGKLEASMTAAGNPRDPVVSGTANMDGGLLELAATHMPYRDITVRATADRTGITLERCSLKSGHGRAVITGGLRWQKDQVPVCDLALQARNFTLMDTAVFSGIIDSDTQYTGPVIGGMLRGTVTVQSSTSLLPRGGRRQAPGLDVIELDAAGRQVVGDGTAAEKESWWNRLQIDGKVQVPGNAWIKGSGLNVAVQGALNVKKSSGKPVTLAGVISAERGTLDFRGRVLSITRGTLNFSGGPEIDPALDATASAKIADITAIITAAGTVTKPEITLTSEPPLDQSEIMSYFVFGRPVARLSDTEGAALQATTTNIAADIAARGLQEVLGRELSPDIIEIGSDIERTVGVGKYINNRLFVKYEWRLGTDEANQTIVQYRLNDRFSLFSQFGNEKTSGLDLLWTHQY